MPGYYDKIPNGYYPPPPPGQDPYATPAGPPPVRRSPAPYPDPNSAYTPQQAYDASNQNSTPLLTTLTLARPPSRGAPEYVQLPPPSWQVTPDKDAAAHKRKRSAPKDTPPSSTKALKTPKRPKHSDADGSNHAKRAKMDPNQVRQLPTPPSTGRELSVSKSTLPPHLKVSAPGQEESNSIEDLPTPVLKLSISTGNEGRKISWGPAPESSNEVDTPQTPKAQMSPRMTTAQVLATDANGFATIGTDEVLESEMAWLENNAQDRSPPTTDEHAILQTPTMDADIVIPDDEADTPRTRAEKMAKRLQAFDDIQRAQRYDNEAMVSTRIEAFGRVAVRKDLAVRFLGIHREDLGAIEETRSEDAEAWSEKGVASGSKIAIKPNWPDDLAPWSLVGGKRKQKAEEEERHRSETLRRYLETASDDSSDDEEVLVIATPGKGKGKSVARLVVPTAEEQSARLRRLKIGWGSANADARIALLQSTRHCAPTILPPGAIACICGASTPVGMGSMIECASCRTWHHLVCCGLEEVPLMGRQWFCAACQTGALALTTPARPTPLPRSGFSQSDERSSVFRGDITNTLAPSPVFMPPFRAAAAAIQTPSVTRRFGSPTRPQRSRMFSFGAAENWFDEVQTPSTPLPKASERFSTPRIDDAAFDVTSTPSRHLDFNFGQPSLFSLTPLGGRSRIPSMLAMDTPLRMRQPSFAGQHDFLKDLQHNKPGMDSPMAGPRWPPGLMGSSGLSPSPFGHRRTMSGGNKLSSLRSSSRLGAAMASEPSKHHECECLCCVCGVPD